MLSRTPFTLGTHNDGISCNRTDSIILEVSYEAFVSLSISAGVKYLSWVGLGRYLGQKEIVVAEPQAS